MPRTKPASNLDAAKRAIRQANRDRLVAELREGRRLRSTRVPSAKTYRRKAKHPHRPL